MKRKRMVGILVVVASLWTQREAVATGDVGPWRGLQTFVYGAGDARITNNNAGRPRDFDFDGSFGPSLDDGLGGPAGGTFLNSITFDALASPNPDHIDTLGGYYRSSGFASVFADDTQLRLIVDVDTAFASSTALPPLSLQATGVAWSRAVGEFLMPPTPITATYFFDVEHTGDFFRQEILRIQNRTTGKMLLEQLQEGNGSFPLLANEGDWISVRLWSSGQSSTTAPPTPTSVPGSYVSHGEVTFAIPEPGPVFLLLVGASALTWARRNPRNTPWGRSLVAIGSMVALTESTQAGEIWTFGRMTGGGGTAHVLDGGLVESGFTFSTGTAPGGASFSASDRTNNPVFGRSAQTDTVGSSRVTISDDFFAVAMAFNTFYTPGSGSLGDRPGGHGEGALWSSVSVVMPDDDMLWHTNVIHRGPGLAGGSTHVVVENVTRALTLLDITTEYNDTIPLEAMTGDLIRIRAEIAGQIDVPPNSSAFAFSGGDVRVDFVIVPEPATGALLVAGVLLTTRKRR
jgi:hypothetical protein